MATAALGSSERKANLLTMHINGYGSYDKQGRSYPMITGPYEVQFTEAELLAHRGWLWQRTAVLRDAMATGVVPSPRYRMAYECRRCPFQPRCADALLESDIELIPLLQGGVVDEQ